MPKLPESFFLGLKSTILENDWVVLNTVYFCLFTFGVVIMGKKEQSLHDRVFLFQRNVWQLGVQLLSCMVMGLRIHCRELGMGHSQPLGCVWWTANVSGSESWVGGKDSFQAETPGSCFGIPQGSNKQTINGAVGRMACLWARRET